MFEGKNDREVAALLKAELERAPVIHFKVDAMTAFQIVGLLQTALRHPQILKRDRELVYSLAHQVSAIGPAVAEAINWGWDATKDKGTGRP